MLAEKRSFNLIFRDNLSFFDVDFEAWHGVKFSLRSVLENVAIDEQVAGLLEAENVFLGRIIIFWRGVMVEMLFVNVEQNRVMRASLHVFKLVCGNLENDDSFRRDFVKKIKTRFANIPDKHGFLPRFLENMVNQ